MTTEERLENLERELARAKRRNRCLLAAVLLGAGVVILAAAWIGTPEKALAANAAKAPTIIRANGFIVEDANGKSRIMLAMTEDGPTLSLLDENGKGRAILNVIRGVAILGLNDENGKPRAMLGVSKEGPAIGLTDENGKTRVGLG